MHVVDILSPVRVAVSRDGGDQVRTKQQVIQRLSQLLSQSASRVEVSATRITPAQYPAFKKFCEDVDRAIGARLVVEQ